MDIYLIIGLTKESRHWSDEFINEIKQKLSPEQIHLVDLPGAGKNLHLESPTTISEIVDKAREGVTFHPDRKRMVIAISLGGMVTWEWVTKYPEDFHQFVMINSSLAGLSPFHRRVQPMAIIDFFKIAASPAGESKETKILNLCSNNKEKAKKILPRWIEIGKEATMAFPNVLRQLAAASKFKAKQVPKLPMLVLAAKHDRLAHYSCSEKIAKKAKATLVLTDNPSVGHAFHVDAPEFIVNEVKAWMKSLPE